MIIFAILLLVQTILNAISDSITHHDGYKSWGYFFSKDATEHYKYNWFHRYFPMFYDAWHLSKTLMLISLSTAIICYTPLITPIIDVFLMFCGFTVTFTYFYEYILKSKN